MTDVATQEIGLLLILWAARVRNSLSYYCIPLNISQTINKRIITIDIIWLLSQLPNPARPLWHLKDRLFNRFSSSTGSRDRTKWLLSWYAQTCKFQLLTLMPSLIRRDMTILARVGAITPFLRIRGYFSLRDSQRSRSKGRLQSLVTSHSPGSLFLFGNYKSINRRRGYRAKLHSAI